jgi:hypothetical protein
MITLSQWNAFTAKRQAELFGQYTFIPRNKYGIEPGHYRDADIVRILRKHKRSPARIQFIADMLE